MHSFDVIAVLIFLSGVFLFINTYFLKLPSSIGLMIMALMLSAVVLGVGNVFPDYHLAEKVKDLELQDILYRFVLSVMLFAGALRVDFRQMGNTLIPIVVLAIFGVLISTFVIAGVLYFVVDLINIEMSFRGCLVFGALISSTDPVAITKNIQRYGLSRELEAKISGEAMLNGVVAIAVAMIVVRVTELENIAGVSLETSDIVIVLLQNIGGGLAAGFVFGWVGQKLLAFVDNDSVEVEVLLTLALVMTGSLVADLLRISPIVLAMMQGLMISNYGKQESGEAALGKYVYRFWLLMLDSMSAMMFVLIGFEMLVIPLRLDYFALGFFAVTIVLFGRWISVFIPIKLLSAAHKFDRGTIPALTWGALRGGLPVAATLSIGHNFQDEVIIITITYVVVVCSVLYQGFTLEPMMRNIKKMNQRASQLK